MFAVNVWAIRATVFALLVVCVVVPAETTHAQFLFWPRHGFWWSDHTTRWHEHRYQRTKPEFAEKDEAQDAPNGPLQIIISIKDQRVSVYDNGALIARSSVSTGIPRHPTPLGVFSVIGKERWHRSNLYSGAPMPYMQRITPSGIALHAGILPGYPASHGCIRLKNDFAIRLWHLTKRGTRVIIARDDTRPVEIANPRLFKSKPQATSSLPESPDTITDSAMTTIPAAHPPTVPNADAQQVTDLQARGSTRAADKPGNIVPISVFVNRKLSKLFVRRGFMPLFDIPVRIRDPEESLGTHVFTVTGSQDEGAGFHWTVVSMPEEPPRTPQAPKRRSPGKQMAEITPAASPDKANAALDRIEIPHDVAENISQLLTPGASLIVSDYGLSKETGNHTDFIVKTH
jgi:L,D-transpeptidase catalytic domain